MVHSFTYLGVTPWKIALHFYNLIFHLFFWKWNGKEKKKINNLSTSAFFWVKFSMFHFYIFLGLSQPIIKLQNDLRL